MSWKSWPYYPTSLTEAVEKRTGVSGEEFVSLIASGFSERIQRPLTLIEPITSDTSSKTVLKTETSSSESFSLRRIDAINPRQHFEKFCGIFRSTKNGDTICKEYDFTRAASLFKKLKKDSKPQFERYECHNGLLDFVGPIFVAKRPVAAFFSGQLIRKGVDYSEVTKMAFSKVKDSLPANVDRDDYCEKLTEAAQKLQTCEMFLQNNKDKSLNQVELEVSFAKIMERIASEIGRIIESEWQAQKRREERQFLTGLLEIFYSSSHLGSRSAIAEKTHHILMQITEYCSLQYIVFFASQQEKISVKPNVSELSFFEQAGMPNGVNLDRVHVNWRAARLPKSLKAHSEQNLKHIESSLACVTRDSNEGRRILQSGIKGIHSGLFVNASAFLPVFLSPRYRGLFILGPFNHLKQEEIEAEREFLSELGFTVGIAILSQIQPADAEILSAAWSDTAAILAHNASRALQPVGDAVRILRSFIDRTGTYEIRHAQEALRALGTAYVHLGDQARKNLEAFAATAEKAYSFQPHNLEEIVGGIVALYRPVAARKAVRLVVEDSIAKFGQIWVDLEKYTLALINLIDNAVKYSHPGRDVVISAIKDAGLAIFIIDDFGLGIERDEREAIYDQGVQGRRSQLAEDEPGEGLGLYQARVIAHAHSGEVTHTCTSGTRRVDSRSLEGYRVRFLLKVPYKR